MKTPPSERGRPLFPAPRHTFEHDRARARPARWIIVPLRTSSFSSSLEKSDRPRLRRSRPLVRRRRWARQSQSQSRRRGTPPLSAHSSRSEQAGTPSTRISTQTKKPPVGRHVAAAGRPPRRRARRATRRSDAPASPPHRVQMRVRVAAFQDARDDLLGEGRAAAARGKRSPCAPPPRRSDGAASISPPQPRREHLGEGRN